ncbi:hypothetical protein [uncultured Mitsuokella sp.]|uniref:hypothetical protein n=1 Tax=uncultured Mitsuokella sp. TaxID=453120 RepID=UPI00258E6FA7|nr:hypothetical protein [uncultured Mitsuokella sp.]
MLDKLYFIDTYSGKVIAAITTDHGLTLDEAIYLADLEEIIIDASTMEKGYKDSDGEEHWVEDLELIS